MSTIDDALLARIAKLHAKAKSAESLGSMNEAEAFTTKVHELLMEHNLSMEDLDGVDLSNEEKFGKDLFRLSQHEMRNRRKRVAWIEDLCSICCKAYGCTYLVRTGSSTLTIVGRETPRTITIYTLATLVRAAESLAQKEYDKYYFECQRTGKMMEYGYKAGFLQGFIDTIHLRFQRERNRWTGNTGKAIVKVDDDRKKAQMWVDEHLKSKSAEALARYTGGQKGYTRGQELAEGLDLEGKAIKNNKPAAKALE